MLDTLKLGLTSALILFSLAGSGTAQEDQATTATVLLALKVDGPAKALDVLGDPASRAAADPFLIQLSPAAGGIQRALAQLGTDEQSEILSNWSLPSAGTARVLIALVPETAPPMEFARAIGERPRKESFAIASVGQVRGVFCSAWMLVEAADDAGTLRKLITHLESRAKSDSNAGFILALARFKDSRSTIEDLKAVLEARVQAETTTLAARMEDSVLLAAAVQRAELAAPCEALAEKLVKYDFAQGAGPWMGFLRRLRAIAILQCHSPEVDTAELLQQTPSLWISASDQRWTGRATGSDRALWLTHEEHVQRLSGPGDDLLLFRYPLSGSFELKGEVSVFDQGTAGMTFGGLAFDANDKLFTVHDVMRPAFEPRGWPFVASKELRMFNRLNVRADGERVLYLSNLHPGASGTLVECETSPWLGLQASGVGRAYFRNLEIVGEPVIPREVNLLKGTVLRGWTTPLGESLPKAVRPLLKTTEPAAAPALPASAWSVTTEGELVSQKRDAEADTTPRQLTLIRPLLDGETLSYEFFYEEGSAGVHPTLGRLAFLLEAGGVRIRWITALTEEWTGLEPDNAVIEPLNRKGPRSLPLKAQEWNAVTLQMAGGKLQISLNGELIYSRPVADLTSHHPGFTHQPQSTMARIRNVKLAGANWPEKLTAEQRTNPVAMSPSMGKKE
jgi:hypothetical protein